MRFKSVFFILEARERQEMERSRTIQGFPLCNQRSQLYIRSGLQAYILSFFPICGIIYRDFSEFQLETLVRVLLGLARDAGAILGKSSRTKGEEAAEGEGIRKLEFREEEVNPWRAWPL